MFRFITRTSLLGLLAALGAACAGPPPTVVKNTPPSNQSAATQPAAPARLPGATSGELPRQFGRVAGARRLPCAVPRRAARHGHSPRNHRGMPPRRRRLAVPGHRRQRPLHLLRAAARVQRRSHALSGFDALISRRRATPRRRSAPRWAGSPAALPARRSPGPAG